MKRFSALFMILIFMLIACPAAAAQDIAVDKECELTLIFNDDEGKAVADMSVYAYRAAELSADGSASFIGSFSSYDISLDVSDRADSAATLADYIQRDGIAADIESKTDSDGRLVLSGLRTGVYLILTETLSDGETLLRAQPLLVDLPMIDSGSGVYAYDVTASPKPVRTVIQKASINVVVRWEDSGSEDKRPKNVTVELYRDGELYDTKTVTAEAGWKYTWDDIDDEGLDGTSSGYSEAAKDGKDRPLAGEHVWHVVELGADGYTVTYNVTPSTNTFVIINTLPPAPQPVLPQTGQLWWPAAVLGICGAALILIGVRKTRRQR